MSKRPTPAVVSMTALAGTATVFAAVAPASPVRPGARSATAERGTVRSTVSGSGSLAAADSATVDFQASGRIEKVYVAEGDTVHAGQLLARLDGTAAKAALAQAKAALAAASTSSSGGGTATTAAAKNVPGTIFHRRRAPRPR